MELMLEYPGLTATVVVGLLAVVVLVAVVLRHRALDARRLNTDVLELLEQGDAAEPLSVEGRTTEFVALAGSLNKLVERDQAKKKPEAGAAPLFEALAQTLPDVTLVHTENILYANDAAADLFGVARETLQGKPVTDLLRPAYRAVVRRQVLVQLEDDQPSKPVEVQLINSDERGLWAELHSRVIDFDGNRR